MFLIERDFRIQSLKPNNKSTYTKIKMDNIKPQTIVTLA